MLKAKKKNRVLRIADAKMADYKALGYTIMQMDGTVIYEPVDAAKQAAALAKENEALAAENAELKAAAEAAAETAAEAEAEAAAETAKKSTKKTAKTSE